MYADSNWKRLRRRLRYWLNHSERNRLLREEMEFHIASMIDDLVAQGLAEPEAYVAAHRRFGNMTQQSEEARSTWIARWISDLVAQDLRHSLRGMRRDAAFTAFAILIAGLGIGASSTVFSVVNALHRCVRCRFASQASLCLFQAVTLGRLPKPNTIRIYGS